MEEPENPQDAEQVPDDAGDSPRGIEEWGTTAGEQREGEPMTERLDREEPEGLLNAEPEVGRLVDPEAEDQADVTPEAVGSEVDEDSDLTAEESAMHIVEPE